MQAVEGWDVIVIGAGPAGLAAAAAAHDRGARVCIIERENRAGGILKQCIHDGFGLIRFEEKLTGPEYAWRDVRAAAERNIPVYLSTFLLELSKDQLFTLTVQNSERGVFGLQARALVAATGCRERTARQIFIHGERPAGIYTAGLVQQMINIDGWMPGRNCVILGSGDIGLIMARRLTLEGARVEGVYELKHEPSGLTRNVVQCLQDYNIPLNLGSTVTRVHGRERVEGVTVVQVDENLRPLPGTEQEVPCDTLVLSVGLIPENDALETLPVEMDARTGGPVVDQLMRTSVPGLFSCGNALHVNDLVDYVSESGEIAGRGAADFARGDLELSSGIPLTPKGDLLYVVPQYIEPAGGGEAVIYFRSNRTMERAVVQIEADGEALFQKKFLVVKPPEMERIVLDLAKLPQGIQELTLTLKG
jgi:thioredoxin reductase